MTAPGSGLQFIVPEWDAPARVRAAFTLRGGGVSAPPYDSLNLGAAIGDREHAVAENRQRVRQALDMPEEPVWLRQVHGTDVLEPDTAGDDSRTCDDPVADAIVTAQRGRVCAVRVADCMPVLFAAHDASVVGAAHAGWRGMAAGVLESTVRKLDVPPASLLAWLGPAIGPANFEVGEEVRQAFTAIDADAQTSFSRNSRGRWQCDLYALARRRLSAIGVERIYGGGWCTYGDATRFFSYRRDGQCGRMAAFIWLER